MNTPAVDDAAKALADPTAYTDDERLHTALRHLRTRNPVAWVDHPPYRPFWAITKHADIMAIERDNELFINAPRPVLAPADADDLFKAQQDAGTGMRTLIQMDDPHHRKARAIGANWFRPRAMRDLKAQVDQLAKRYVDKMREIGPECDFVTDIAADFPLYVILSLLGLPESDFPRMQMLTQEMFGRDDTEHQRAKDPRTGSRRCRTSSTTSQRSPRRAGKSPPATSPQPSRTGASTANPSPTWTPRPTT